MKVRKRKYFIYKNELNTNTKKKENNSTIETKFDTYNNEVSMYETVK